MSVLRRIVALLLLFVMMFCITKNTALCAFYSLNSVAFVSLFCENINKPTLKCNGRCQLSKMAKDEQSKQAEKVLSSSQSEIFLYYQSSCLENVSFGFTTEVSVILSLLVRENYSYLYFFRNDKPPQFLS